MVWHYLVTSLYNDDDTFLTRIRKSMVGVFFFPLSFIAFLYVFYGFLVAKTVTNYFHAVATLLISLSLMVSYGRMRMTRTVTNNHIALCLWFILVVITMNYIGGPAFDNKSLAIALFLLAVLMQHPHLPFYVVALVLQCLLIDWNKVMISNDKNEWILAPPGYRAEDPIFSQFAGHIIGTICVFSAGLTFSKCVKETAKKEAAQTAANQLTLEVLRYQRKYDTDAVSKLLSEKEAEEDRGGIDAEFIELFKNMNENLLRYKPFLPNYVFQAYEDSDEDNEGLIEGGDSESGVGRGGGGGSLVSSRSKSFKKYATHDNTSRSSRHSSRTSHSQQMNHTATATPHHGMVKAVGRGEYFRGKLAFATLDISLKTLTSSFSAVNDLSGTVPGDRSLTGAIYKQVVNTVYRLAKETKASVHSMLGDRVQLTWNATHNLALPETKAATFLARIQDKLNATAPLLATGDKTSSVGYGGPISISGAVCSGVASVHAITSETQQQALVVEAKWTNLLSSILSLASKHKTVLMDENTKVGSALEVDSCPVECAFFQASSHVSKDTSTSTTQPTTTSDDGVVNFLYNAPTISRTTLKDLATDLATTAKDGTPDEPASSKKTQNSNNNPTAVASTNKTGFQLISIYQILGEKERADDEWMYQIQHDAAYNNTQNGSSRGQANKTGGQQKQSLGMALFPLPSSAPTQSTDTAGASVADQLSSALGSIVDLRFGDAATTLDQAEDKSSSSTQAFGAKVEEPHDAKTSSLLDDRKGDPKKKPTTGPQRSFLVAAANFCQSQLISHH